MILSNNNNWLCRSVVALTLCCLTFAPARADESPFSYIHTAEVLPQGAMEIEQWGTWSWNKPQEDFYQWKGRTEFEYGVSNRFLLAGYLNYAQTKIEPQGPSAPDGPENETKFESVSIEGIYQMLNPFIDPFGLALYVEPSLGDKEHELEFQLLVQKNLLDDRLILAANFILEYEWERNSDEWERESKLGLYVGASYRIAPGWFMGTELLNENAFEGHFLSGSKAETNAYYSGPTLHYATQNWWATLSVLMQLPWAGNPSGEPDILSNGYLRDMERTRLRMRIGIPL